MKVLQRTVALAAVAALAAVPVQDARADIVPATGGGLFRWDYAIVLSKTQNLSTADFFVIYDFGRATGALAPAGWSVSADPSGPATVTGQGSVTPTQTNALNWTFVWTGGPLPGRSSLQNLLGALSLTSTPAPGSPAAFSAFIGDGSSPVTGFSEASITETQVPVANPEPASLFLLGTGMLGLVGFVRRRNK